MFFARCRPFMLFVVACAAACGTGSLSATGDKTKPPDAGDDPNTPGGTDTTNPGGSSVEQELVSGTRLKAVTLTGSDGSASPGGFYDTQFNESCSIFTDPAGNKRCLPGASAELNYWDSSCQSPCVYITACSNSLYARVDTLVTCDRYTHDVYLKGERISAGSIYSKSGYSCNFLGAATSFQNGFFYKVTSALPTSSFVSFTETH